MTKFLTRKRDKQVFAIKAKVARDSGTPSVVGKVDVSKIKLVKLKKGEKFQCTACQKVYTKPKKQNGYYVCPKCGSMEAEVIKKSSPHQMSVKVKPTKYISYRGLRVGITDNLAYKDIDEETKKYYKKYPNRRFISSMSHYYGAEGLVEGSSSKQVISLTKKYIDKQLTS